MGRPFPRKELFARRSSRVFGGDATEAAFLLGGIGTGNVSVGARGELRDWEIFGRPAKGQALPYSFFSIYLKPQGGQAIARVLESRLTPPFSGPHGFVATELAGLPRFARSRMRGEYPFVWVELEDDELPVSVTMEAFTPFIPLNADDSGIPGAVIRYCVTNNGKKSLDVTIAGSLANAVGYAGRSEMGHHSASPTSVNELRKGGPLQGLFYHDPQSLLDSVGSGTMALATGDAPITAKRQWLGCDWWDGAQDFWNDFSSNGCLVEEPTYDPIPVESRTSSRPKIGSLGTSARIRPGQQHIFEFFLTWHFPNRQASWRQDCEPGGSCAAPECKTIRMYYGKLFADAWAAAEYLRGSLPRLEAQSWAFHDAIFGSTYPSYVIDALASNITVLRSPTCFRIEDGTLLGWEGCHNKSGCCQGSCTHVWNYAQTLAFLFPQLEQTMRRVEFGLETDGEGKMTFRTQRVFGQPSWGHHPAADGQNGTIIRLYREWKLTGDDEFLRELWPAAARAMDFAFEYWDSDKDCVLDSQQHNTYDIEFYGPNSLCNSMFFAALKAAAEMAQYVGDSARAERYREAFEQGSRRMDELLWNGEYYVQRLEKIDEHRYQYGDGCLADQLLGQFLAHVVGLGYILPPQHVRKALKSIFRHNFRRDFSDMPNAQRTYALNDEAGLLLCTWPGGGRPRFPFPYCDEVWTGFEYQVAASLIFEGLIDEGLTVVKAARDRHDGYRRNPWNEVECGHHYARSMSSWGLLVALSGVKADMVSGTLSFEPRINADNFSTFWSTGKAWGVYRQKKSRKTGKMQRELEVVYDVAERCDGEASQQ